MKRLIPGVVFATVEALGDPDGDGAIQVKFPWLDDQYQTAWAPIAWPMAGNDYGVYLPPQVGDECIVGFVQGDIDYPIVLGFLHNGVARPPRGHHVRRRIIKTPSGAKIEFLDGQTPTATGLIIEDAVGNRVMMTSGKVTVSSLSLVEITAPTVTINGRVVAPIPSPI